MAKQNEALFEESSQGAVSAITATVFVLSAVLVFGGVITLSYAFGAGGAEVQIFTAGLVVMLVGLVLPFAWLPATGK